MSEAIQAAGVLVVAPDSGWVLAFRRADSGRLGLPFGSVDPGEAPRAAAARECLEETGYVVRLRPDAPFLAPTPSGRLAATFLADLTGEHRAPTHPEEGSPEWVSRADLMQRTAFSAYLEGMFAFFSGAGSPG